MPGMMIVLEKELICSGASSMIVPSFEISINVETNSVVPEVLVRDEPVKVILVSVPAIMSSLLESRRVGVIGPVSGAVAIPNP